MYYLCKEDHRVAFLPMIILFILRDVSLTQNVFMISMCCFEIIMYFKGWIKEFLSSEFWVLSSDQIC